LLWNRGQHGTGYASGNLFTLEPKHFRGSFFFRIYVQMIANAYWKRYTTAGLGIATLVCMTATNNKKADY
jgi:hypothetical protein